MCADCVIGVRMLVFGMCVDLKFGMCVRADFVFGVWSLCASCVWCVCVSVDFVFRAGVDFDFAFVRVDLVFGVCWWVGTHGTRVMKFQSRGALGAGGTFAPGATRSTGCTWSTRGTGDSGHWNTRAHRARNRKVS